METNKPVFPGFTSNEELDEWVDKSDMGYFAGFVTRWSRVEKASNGCPVARTVLSNNQGTFLQIVAWGMDLINRLKPLSTTGTLLVVDGGITRDLTNFTKFNDGNVNWELRLTSNTILTGCGMMQNDTKSTVVPTKSLKK